MDVMSMIQTSRSNVNTDNNDHNSIINHIISDG